MRQRCRQGQRSRKASFTDPAHMAGNPVAPHGRTLGLKGGRFQDGRGYRVPLSRLRERVGVVRGGAAKQMGRVATQALTPSPSPVSRERGTAAVSSGSGRT
jgi:hypothetical protein